MSPSGSTASPGGALGACESSRLASVAGGDLVEVARIEVVGRRGHDASASAGRQRRGPGALLQPRPFADDRTGPDLAHHLAVDADLEDAVQDEEEIPTDRPLFDERLAGLERPRLRAISHDLERQLALE